MINRRRCIAAAILSTLICGVSFSEESTVKTNNQELIALCKTPETTPEDIETLLETGADIKTRDKDGSTPLMQAAERNSNPAIIKILLKAGADVNVRTEGASTSCDSWAGVNAGKVVEPPDR